MSLPDIDTLLWAISYSLVGVLVFELFTRRLYQMFPIFTGYLIFALVTDPGMIWVRSQIPALYFNAYFALNTADYLFQLAVLLEIGLNVVRPVKRSLPAGILWVLAGLTVAGALVAFLFAFHATPHLLTRMEVLFVKLNLGMALLRLSIFAAIAFFAQMLGIGWKNHVLQLATGLAFYSAVSLIVTTVQSTMGLTRQFHPLAQIQVASYLGTLAFWIWSFAQEEAPRRKFSPQMQNFLVSIAGSAHTGRIALESEIGKTSNRKR